MAKLLLALLAAALAAPARANPMLEKCLPFAPPVCGVTDKSSQEEFLACFENIRLRSTTDPKAAACAEELAHARVHKACGADDLPKLCAGVKPGGGKTMGCLRANRPKLGADCGKALDAYDALQPPKGDDDALKGRKKKKRGGAVAAQRC